MPKPLPSHIPSLDGLRGVAILCVVLCHAAWRGDDLFRGDPGPRGALLVNAEKLGWVGVDLFFVLSGFLITGVLVDSKSHPHYFRNFYVRRALRIFPLYYLLLAVRFNLPTVVHPPSPAEVISYLFYAANVWSLLTPAESWDPWLSVTWSLSVEEQFYLVWPLLVWLLPRRSFLWACLFAIVAAPCLRAAVWGWNPWGPYFLTPCRVDDFAFGAVVAVLARDRGADAVARCSRPLVAAGGLGLVAVVTFQGRPSPDTWPMAVFGYSAAGVFFASVLAVALRPGLIASFCEQPILRAFGKYSYAIYLIHLPLLRSLVVAAGASDGRPIHNGPFRPFAALLLFAVAALTSLVIGWLSWNLYERHWLKLKMYFPQ